MNRLNSAVPPNTVRADRLKAVVLDWAGTTVDFGSLAPARTMQRLFRDHGIELPEPEARRHMGLPKKEHIRGILAIPRIREAWELTNGSSPSDADVDVMYGAFIPLQFSCLMEHSALIPAVAETVHALRARGLKIGSSTGYTREMLDMLLDAAAREGYQPDCSLTPDEVGGGRPYPYMMFECAIRLQVYPLSAVVKVGDTPADVAEGLNAGSWAIGVAGTGNSIGLCQKEFDSLPEADKLARLTQARNELRDAGAHYVVDSMRDLLPVLDDIEERLRST